MATKCRLPSNPDSPLTLTGCATAKGKTFCVGDRVRRTLKGQTHRHGEVLALQMGADNSGRPKQAARVCFDSDEPGDLAYGYLFEELAPAAKKSLRGAKRRRLAAPRVTIYDALRARIGREPTSAEIKAEVQRIKTEALIDAATAGRLPHQRRRRRR